MYAVHAMGRIERHCNVMKWQEFFFKMRANILKKPAAAEVMVQRKEGCYSCSILFG